MKKFRAIIKLDDENSIEMIVSEKSKESAKKMLVDFYHRLDRNIKVEIELEEVYFDGSNYIGMEN